MKFVVSSASQSSITCLKMNRVFNRRTPARQNAMGLIAKALNTVPIEEFEIMGDKKSNKGLKADLLDVVFGLLANKTLTKLDLSGNQAGDDLGVALGKVFQHNNTLSNLVWDNNEMGIVGFKALKLGLERNLSMQYLEGPIDDIFALKAKQEVNPEQLSILMKDIQKVIFENQRQRATDVVESSSKKISIKGAQKPKTKKGKGRHPPVDLVDVRRASVAFLYAPKKENPPPPADAPEPASIPAGQ